MLKLGVKKIRQLGGAYFRQKEKYGTPPGTPVYTGESRRPFRVTRLLYNKLNLERQEQDDVEPEFLRVPEGHRAWFLVQGLADGDKFTRLAEHFALEPLIQEDILNQHQDPKAEDLEEQLFLVLRTVLSETGEAGGEPRFIQLSLIVRKNYVLTFLDSDLKLFRHLFKRMEAKTSRVRAFGSDFLCYAIFDLVLDSLFLTCHKISDDITNLEESILMERGERPVRSSDIYPIKKQLIQMGRLLWPTRGVLQTLRQSEGFFVKKSYQPYLTDLSDHLSQAQVMVDTQRELVSELMNLHLTRISNEMNNVMKVLTVIATLFIPLTFITGLYGMNFKIIPELEWTYGYAFVWGIILLTTAGLLYYFRRKKWF